MLGLAAALSASLTPAIDVDDMLRAALVQGVSAFDRYVHEAIRDSMMAIHRGSRSPTPSYEAFAIPLAVVAQGLAAPSTDAWLEAEIVRQHALRSFQKSDKVAEATRLVSPHKLWERVASAMRMPAQDIRRQLDLIVDRRNQIVHQSDADPVAPGARWPIAAPDVVSSLDFLERVGRTIDALLG